MIRNPPRTYKEWLEDHESIQALLGLAVWWGSAYGMVTLARAVFGYEAYLILLIPSLVAGFFIAGLAVTDVFDKR